MTDWVTELGAIPLLSNETIVGMESFSQMDKETIRKQILTKRACEPLGELREDNDYNKVSAYRTGNIVHLYLNEANLYFDKYLVSLFTWISELKKEDHVHIYFYSSWEVYPTYLIELVPIINALQTTEATIVATIYNPMSIVGTIIALTCKSLKIGEFGYLQLNRPEVDWLSRREIFYEYFDMLYQRLVDNGLLKQEEFEKLQSNSSYILTLYSAELRTRLKTT